jgi:hypothetical protein
MLINSGLGNELLDKVKSFDVAKKMIMKTIFVEDFEGRFLVWLISESRVRGREDDQFRDALLGMINHVEHDNFMRVLTTKVLPMNTVSKKEVLFVPWLTASI